MLKILAVSFLVLLSGCAAPLLVTGLGVSSVAVNETTGKTIADQTVSAVSGQDCRVSRAFKDQAVCQDVNTVKVVTTTTKPSTVAEIESRYRQ
jgi:predicted regulator of amino acid metabolism with ACT domain